MGKSKMLPLPYLCHAMQLFPADIIHTLELDKVLARVAELCESAPGRDRVLRVRPQDNYDEVHKMLRQTQEMVQLLRFGQAFPQERIFDIRSTLPLLQIENYILTTQQCFEIAKVALFTGSVLRYFQTHTKSYPVLNKYLSGITYEGAIAAAVNKAIDAEGNIRPDASPELAEILRAKNDAVRSLGKAFTSALQQYRSAGFLSDVEESVRNNRRVLGIQSEYKRKVQGIIHDESETGRTVFIEPQSVVHIQNEIFELDRAELREIHRILQNLTATLAPFAGILEKYQQVLGVIDFTRAKARYAIETDCAMPVLNKKPIIRLYHARHPVLLALHKKQNKPVIPLQVELDDSQHIIVISGPNAGGKSVAMKTIGLLVLMTQCGMLIPASEHSEIGMFKNVFCDIGDTQSLEDELSTYSARLLKLRHFLRSGDPFTLILIDEFGSGTDPVMGGAIAEAALHQLHEKKVFGVITTHYPNLKSFAASTHGILNGSMLFDENTLSPQYLLESGKPGSSYAFELAKKSNLPDALIQEARNKMSKEHIRFEELLKHVRIEKEHMRLREKEITKKENALKQKEEDLQTALEKTREQRERYQLKKLEKEEGYLRAMEADFKKLLQTLKETLASPEADNATKEKAKESVRQFIRERRKVQRNDQEKQPIPKQPQYKTGEVKIGGLVKLPSGSEVGRLESVRNNKAVVIFNQVRTTVAFKDLIGIAEDNGDAIVETKPVKLSVTFDASDFPTELDLRGKPREEAMLELEQYLDRAMMRKVFQARIVHGKGTGVIREMAQQILRSHPGVRQFEYAVRESGGDGVTLVTFN